MNATPSSSSATPSSSATTSSVDVLREIGAVADIGRVGVEGGAINSLLVAFFDGVFHSFYGALPEIVDLRVRLKLTLDVLHDRHTDRHA